MIDPERIAARSVQWIDSVNVVDDYTVGSRPKNLWTCFGIPGDGLDVRIEPASLDKYGDDCMEPVGTGPFGLTPTFGREHYGGTQ